ncbi:MAG: glutamine synthetase III [bacterium]
MRQKINVAEIFGSNVFNDKVMRKVLPKTGYAAIRKVIETGAPLTKEVADIVAEEMKLWAIKKGASHYTHWFQPLTGSTAEKHDSFINPTADGGVIMEFEGKQLIKGEPDASSFPSGGLRSTFEARGYTAWDPTSPAFLKEDAGGDVTLCIPTAFYSYNGVALDAKVPLLRSMEAVSEQSLRVTKALGNKKTKKVISTVGPEQEYFLVDKKYFLKRLDLMLCGRTLFGAPAPKGQELEDHYFASIKDRVADYMKDLDIELWKMGIASKTKHNEVAPAQFEMAPVYGLTNAATDHNQLVMETMQKVALRNDFVCLLHEKPYKGVNGSGKHNNWSLGTDDGLNLLDPGNTPHQNKQFLMFLSALITAVDRHADLLRASAATSGNDHRLGANEAPPAIISIFLGDDLTDMLDKIAKGQKVEAKGKVFIKMGVDTLPDLPKDNTDRNRTSPFAFTGNKFEFRMVGSSMSISNANIVLNTIVAEALDEIATRLEGAKDVNEEIVKIVRDMVKNNIRVVFNGNNYSEEWVKEAAKRGLPNIKNTVDAIKSFATKKATDLFAKYEVLSKEELHSRFDIYMEQYAKQINIEAQTAVQMVKRLYIPSVLHFTRELASTVNEVKTAKGNPSVATELLDKVSNLLDSANKKLVKLEEVTIKAKETEEATAKAEIFRDKVFTAMAELREDIDALESILPETLWPVPSYTAMMFKL